MSACIHTLLALYSYSLIRFTIIYGAVRAAAISKAVLKTSTFKKNGQ